jgi:2Fe-2S ferredoxin
VVVVTRDGQAKDVDAISGLSVMEIIRDAGIDELLALCGGCCSCATCHVHVDRAYGRLLADMRDDERELLSLSDDRDETSRLACQLPFTAALDGLRVRIAAED